MIELIREYLTDWRKAPEITKILKESGVKAKNMKSLNRKFRDAVAKYNRNFMEGKTEYFVAHSNKGYRLTTDASEIANSLLDDRKRALKLFKRYYSGMKELSERDLISLLPNEDADIFEAISMMESV